RASRPRARRAAGRHRRAGGSRAAARGATATGAGVCGDAEPVDDAGGRRRRGAGAGERAWVLGGDEAGRAVRTGARGPRRPARGAVPCRAATPVTSARTPAHFTGRVGDVCRVLGPAASRGRQPAGGTFAEGRSPPAGAPVASPRTP